MKKEYDWHRLATVLVDIESRLSRLESLQSSQLQRELSVVKPQDHRLEGLSDAVRPGLQDMFLSEILDQIKARWPLLHKKTLGNALREAGYKLSSVGRNKRVLVHGVQVVQP